MDGWMGCLSLFIATEQFFNQHTFSLEERLYRSEGIKFTSVTYIDNQPVLDLIEKVSDDVV